MCMHVCIVKVRGQPEGISFSLSATWVPWIKLWLQAPFKKAEGKSIKRLMLLKVRCLRF